MLKVRAQTSPWVTWSLTEASTLTENVPLDGIEWKTRDEFKVPIFFPKYEC